MDGWLESGRTVEFIAMIMSYSGMSHACVAQIRVWPMMNQTMLKTVITKFGDCRHLSRFRIFCFAAALLPVKASH